LTSARRYAATPASPTTNSSPCRATKSSDLFTDREKAALDYAAAVMRTPVEVTDELFARVRPYFDDRQLVEITALLALVNLDRFNAAFGIGSAGFSDGMVCVAPDRPDPARGQNSVSSGSTPRIRS